MKRILTIMGITILIGVGCDSATDPMDNDPLFEDVPAGKSLASLDIQGTLPPSMAKMMADSVVLAVTDYMGAPIGALTLHTALVALGEIEFKNEDEEELPDSLEMEIEFEGPYVVDLIANTVTPSLDTVVIDTGIYRQIELKLDKIEGDEDDDHGMQLVDASDPLFGNSIYVSGTYTGATAGGDVSAAPFTMSFELDEEFELSTVDPISGMPEASLGFSVDEGVVNPIIIAFRLADWLDFSNPETNEKQLDFGDLITAQDTSGTTFILLNKDADGDNQDIREVIKENIKESADYGEDSDGDGHLEDDEDDDDDNNS